ncbi:MAG: response regulator [Eubacteriales bacterium]|nr:response regulator [Eubacteriales bacterium]
MSRDGQQRKNATFIIWFFVMTSLAVAVVGYNCHRKKQMNLERAEELISSERTKLQYALDSRLMNTQVLKALVISHEGQIRDFEKIASLLYSEDPAIRSLQLAPDGMVTYVYPLENNEKAFINLFEDPQRKSEAERARDSGELTLAGPYELMQGGMGLVARDPIYLMGEGGQKNFWGFSIVVFNVPEIFNIANLNLLASRSYQYRLWRYLPGGEDIQVIAENTDKELEGAIRREVMVPNTTWYLDIKPQGGWVTTRQLLTSIALTFLVETIVLLVVWFRKREKETERIHRESDQRQKEALKDAYEAAERASRAKSDFLSGMSHDIRTPLNGIIGMVAIASANRDDPARVSDCLAKITASSRHLLGLINEVLDMSRIESGKVTLTEESFNLSDLVDNLIQLSMPGVNGKKQELVVRNRGIQHEEVIGDSLRLQQAFVNIVGNAVKYTPEGGTIEIESWELPSDSSKTGEYKFVFRDNGIGMSKEFAATIFEPFSRERSSQVDKIQGTGLGMAITKNIVQMMDGSITVESEPGKGSVFTVILRLKLQTEKEEGQESFLGLPVLVVDDDRSVCESTCLILDEIGMESGFALSGREAVEMVAEAHSKGKDYYAVIVDWKMPDMDGLDTARAIREAMGVDVPIIVCSAYDWSDVEEEAREAGVSVFVSKPLFKSKLVNTFVTVGDQEPSREEGESLAVLEKMDLGGKHLLLVEDLELNREIAKEIIEMTRIQVDTAENGEQAVARFQESDSFYYDLILMDVQMPIMNGYEATRAIRAMDRPDARSVPIIAMTADAFAEDVEKAMAAQMNEHLAKPLDIQKLADMLARWIPR